MAQQHINDIANNCLYFTDRNGRVLNKHGNPGSKSLEMEYKDKDLTIYFFAFASPRTNGSCHVKVTEKGNVVFEAEGNYTAYAHGMAAKIYVPGNWEEKIPEWKK